MVDILSNRPSRTTARPKLPPDSPALKAVGDWLLTHQSAIRQAQWVVVGIYVLLLVVPAFMPLPDRAAHIWSSMTLFAQFAFWGIWWPFVLLSMVLVGRVWCGLLCPEGALSEAASKHGLGRAMPRWLVWKGWPFVAFACTTIYGQMVSVYQYAAPALLVLGGSTVAAVVIGYIYGRNKRVWCRFMCPVTGVFGLLAKLAPLHFRVNTDDWNKGHAPGVVLKSVNCAPLVPLRTMRGASQCHMCGRCSGFRGAISLARRSPNHEIVHVAGQMTRPWETVLILFGLMGIASGAFLWTSSDIFVSVKQALAEFFISHGMMFLIEPRLPWWILTNYPEQNDMLTPLDGGVMIGYILSCSLIIGGGAAALLALATRLMGAWSSQRFHHLAQSLIPIAGCGVFLGLSALTVTMLRNEGITLPLISELRALLLGGAGLWSLVLFWKMTGLYANTGLARVAASLAGLGAIGLGLGSWALLFWG